MTFSGLKEGRVSRAVSLKKKIRDRSQSEGGLNRFLLCN